MQFTSFSSLERESLSEILNICIKEARLNDAMNI